jgi:uncharacterized protein YndB with AHSA1/START domain
MKNALQTVFAVALVALITAAIGFTAARANHYILPCPPDCRDIRIGPGMTGSWSVPDQSGHGFTIEVLAGEPPQMLVSWFVFGPQGGHAWIIAHGPVDGARAELQGQRITGSGGRFPPNFDPAGVRAEPWGTLTFAFGDCNHGRVEWASTEPGFGNGIVNITRLTLPAGLTCDGTNRVGDAEGVPH